VLLHLTSPHPRHNESLCCLSAWTTLDLQGWVSVRFAHAWGSVIRMRAAMLGRRWSASSACAKWMDGLGFVSLAMEFLLLLPPWKSRQGEWQRRGFQRLRVIDGMRTTTVCRGRSRPPADETCRPATSSTKPPEALAGRSQWRRSAVAAADRSPARIAPRTSARSATAAMARESREHVSELLRRRQRQPTHLCNG